MEEKISFTHDELLEITTKTLSSLIEGDPLLSDLPTDVTLEEVSAQLALQYGQSMTVYVTQENGQEMPIVVEIGGTVLDLKRAIRRHLGLVLKRKQDKTKISWKYVWRNNCLVFDGERLTKDTAKLVELGIKNRSRLSFAKRIREKNHY